MLDDILEDIPLAYLVLNPKHIQLQDASDSHSEFMCVLVHCTKNKAHCVGGKKCGYNKVAPKG